MDNYDGDIKLSMSLDPKDVKATSKSLQDDIKQIFEQNAGKKLTNQFKQLEASMNKTASKAKELTDKMITLENTKIPTQEYQEIEKQINADSAALNKLKERMDKFLETGGSTKSNVFRRMQYDIAQLENSVLYAKGELQDLVDTGKAFTLGSETAEYQKTAEQLGQVNNQMRVLKSRAEAATNSVSKGTQVFKSFTSVCKKLPGILKNITKSSKNTDQSMKKLFTNMLKYGLGIRSIYVLFRKLRTAIGEGINNLVQTSGGMNQTNQAISSLMSSLNALKNAWGAAFAPIIQVVAPILSKFIDMLTMLTNKLAMFISGMTGKATATVAKKTDFNYAESLDKTGTASGRKQREKYEAAVEKAQAKYEKDLAKVREKNAKAQAKAEEKQAKAAEKLAKKQEKANKELGAYDKLNVIAKEDAEELEDIQAEEYEEPNLEDYLPDLEDYMQGMTDFNSMFEEVPIESTISDFIQRLKDAWNQSDFTEIGKMFGERLKEISNQGTQWLVNEAQPFVEKLGTVIGSFVNGLTEDVSVAQSLGTLFGEALNTFILGLNSLLDSTDWDQLGTFIGEGLNSLVNSFDWEGLGHLLVMKWNAIFETLKGFVDTFDFKELGNGIVDGLVTMIEDFDASAFAGSISGLIAGLFEIIIGFFEGTDWIQLGKTIFQKAIDLVTGIEWERLFDAVFEALGAALGGVNALLGALMYKIGELLAQAWDEFVDWFYEVAYEDGEFTIKGLLEGILNVMSTIGTWIYDHIFKPFIDGFKKAFGIASPSKVMESMAILLMDGLKKGITDKISDLIAKFNDIKNKIKKVFNDIKTEVLKIWNSLWSSLRSVVNTAWNGIKTVLNSILSGMERMVNGLITGINMMIQAVNNLDFDIPDWVPMIGGENVGFNIPELSSITIPRLAQGAVIPPNKQFLAMLGDQNKGTNIEAPLDTIVEAVMQALDKKENKESHEPIVLKLDGRTVAEAVWDEQEKRYKQRGSYTPVFG